ncbi:MAG TPA: hypothetical protein PLW93_00305 [Candidatus Absconditabacterales bacterium]|nr:hypothetical protein [Candidatus Absconditabacterales bacterium]
MDKVPNEVMFGGNEHKIDPSDTTAFSYHIVETVADGTSKDIIVPFSINSVQCQSFITNRVCSGSMGTGSQGCYYIDNTGLGAVVAGDTTKMINLGIGTVTCTINGRILTIANSGVGATITTILTFFA